MAFKLGDKSKVNSKDFKLRFSGDSDIRVGGVDIIPTELPNGILGEANDDGTIYISNKLDPNSMEFRKVLNHEMKHMTDMKLGKTSYTDEYVCCDGIKYPRKNGKVLYNGSWVMEGDTSLPWEYKD